MWIMIILPHIMALKVMWPLENCLAYSKYLVNTGYLLSACGVLVPAKQLGGDKRASEKVIIETS